MYAATKHILMAATNSAVALVISVHKCLIINHRFGTTNDLKKHQTVSKDSMEHDLKTDFQCKAPSGLQE